MHVVAVTQDYVGLLACDADAKSYVFGLFGVWLSPYATKRHLAYEFVVPRNIE